MDVSEPLGRVIPIRCVLLPYRSPPFSFSACFCVRDRLLPFCIPRTMIAFFWGMHVTWSISSPPLATFLLHAA